MNGSGRDAANAPELACPASPATRGVIRAWLCAVALGAALACASGTPYAQLSGELPALAPGQGRILIYMQENPDYYGFFPNLTVDGDVVGRIKQGTFFYVDRPAGSHTVGVRADERLAAFGNQGDTEPVSVELDAGGTAYVRVDLEITVGMVTPVLTPEVPSEAQRELAPLDAMTPKPESP